MAQARQRYTLHYFPFSIYSIMARFGFVLGKALDAETAPIVDVKLVNLHDQENLSEAYLTTVNQKGQVPALTGSALRSPIADSHEIANWQCEKQPQLLPEDQRVVIHRIMDEIHGFHAMALAVAADARKHGLPNQAAAILENPTISDSHRRALEIKSLFHETYHSRTLEAENIAHVEEQARGLIAELEDLLVARGDRKPWLFGDRPTILDAHAATLAIRLVDMKRDDLLSDLIRQYAREVRATREWQLVTGGRPTIWDSSIGPVRDTNPL